MIGVQVIEPDLMRARGIAGTLNEIVGYRVSGQYASISGAIEQGAFAKEADILLFNLDAKEFSEVRTWTLLRLLAPDIVRVACAESPNIRALELAIATGVQVIFDAKLKAGDLGSALDRAATCSPQMGEKIKDLARFALMNPPNPTMARGDDASQMSPPGKGNVLDGYVKSGIDDENSFDLPVGPPQVGSLLTSRECEVLALMASGTTNRGIAYKLGIGERTARFHVENIFSKLRVSNRTSAVVTAIKLGILAV